MTSSVVAKLQQVPLRIAAVDDLLLAVAELDHARPARVDAGPHGTEPQGVGGQQQVLGGGRAVDRPVAFGELQAAVAADEDAQRGAGGHGRVGMRPADLAKQPAVVDHRP